ncbi:hypothetical protein HYALB_00013730 [Hymenoscyphus albidus]|uniref:Putative gamma-glutamylcyclotransferase n=1 Tax=Hymenoscyphus albidus TaxID=595503 RepID=A0A9N9QAI8_9HELO|nr:hypothetical protein HYALB_00013730 [Hymenoscyphus albidus]
MGDRTAFFYGTLMAKEILYRVCFGDAKADQDSVYSIRTSQITIVPAILHDYQRHKVIGCQYPGIRQQKGQEVRGTYVTGLTDADVFRLDRFEGNQYDREDVKVRLLNKDGSEGDEEHRAETYVFKYEEELEKEEWCYEEFRREKLKNWVGSSSVEYDEVDNAAAINAKAAEAAKAGV